MNEWKVLVPINLHTTVFDSLISDFISVLINLLMNQNVSVLVSQSS
jgi:hypothetical protein